MPLWLTTEQPDTDKNGYFNWTQHANNSNDQTIRIMYKYTVPALLIFCIISLAINVRILISIYWIRRPLSPTLHISLSLAGADAYTSLILATGLVVNSLLPVGLGITFMLHLKFRAVFSVLFFAPLLLMLIIYMHIFSIVRRHQVNRLRFSQINHGSRHHSSNGHGSSGSNSQQMTRSVKAIHTTLFILGSYIIGWMPAVLSYLLFCEDCLFHFNTFNKSVMFFIYTIVNLLVIFKTLLNPIIYAARMHEIKMAIPRMHATLCRCCCLFLTEDLDNSERSLHRLSQYYASSNNLQRSNTTICRMHSCPATASNGNTQVHELLQRKSSRGHHHHYNHRRRRDDSSTDL
ncbi:hypothetical protein B7P43_G03013 [Cryptotermes secundus]|uniref:G-protein coupled receptors family 1 profile domain-containing protein n=1 Tax=Cryptotermes secundus TaxID=105785 RepID=A0A2J7QY29_9NEOP|nr:hypothetical protein B7P43_G03013 [Cryptotermes secundus]